MKKILLIAAGLVAALFWVVGSPHPPQYDFYYWKQAYEVNATSHPPKYIKVLDLSYDQEIQLHPTHFKTIPKSGTVPVIYIHNTLLSHITADELLATIKSQLQALPFSFDEIQIDCDWSGKTQKSYFQFLTLLKKDSGKKLSATIRLHQIKYAQQTGIPPVDRGVLMYYNMSDFKDIHTQNYILDLDIAKQYHRNFDRYTLPLDLALPLYTQATIIRFGEVIGAIEGLLPEDLTGSVEPLEPHRYRVTQEHYLKGRLLYPDDIIRIDTVSIDDLKHAVQQLSQVMKTPEEVIFYRWENQEFYGEEDLMEVIKSF